MSIRLNLLVMFMVLSSLSCEPPPPQFVELSTPRGSVDSLGPYLFTARITGEVDEVVVVWVRQTPTDQDSVEAPSIENDQDQQRLVLTRDGEVWVGALEGGPKVATYFYYLEANGAGGSTREPLTGHDTFEVEALTGRCLTDAECLDGELCHREEFYCFAAPDECSSDIHCPRDQFCNRNTRQCRFFDGGCVDDSECDVNSDCIEGRCVNPNLTECERGCLPRERCENDVCVPNTECSTPCTENEICSEGVCVEASCYADGMCPNGYACDLAQQRCVVGERGVFCQPCGETSSEIDAQCGVGFSCREGLSGCRPTCGSEGPNKPICHLFETCIDGICVDDFSDWSCNSFECFANDECESGLCSFGRCVDSQSCSDQSDCAREASCQFGQCYQPNACEMSGCPSGERCWNGVCEPYQPALSSCQSCFNDQECAPQEHCTPDFSTFESVCQRPCSRDDHCVTGEACIYISEILGYCIDLNSFTCYEFEPEFCDFDQAEPNNQFSEATPLVLSGGAQLTDRFLQCAYDDDYFYLDRPLGSSYLVNWYSDGPGYLYLFDDNLIPLAELFSSPAGVSFELTEMLERVSYFQVIGVEELSTPYFFEFIPISGGGTQMCNDDSLEENDFLSSSYRIGRGASLSLTLCPGDEDWFSARGDVGEIFQVHWERLDNEFHEVEIAIGNEDQFLEGSERISFITDNIYNFVFTFNNLESKYIRIRCLDCEQSFNYVMSTD